MLAEQISSLPQGIPKMVMGKGRGTGAPKTLQDMFNKIQSQHRLRFGEQSSNQKQPPSVESVTLKMAETKIETLVIPP